MGDLDRIHAGEHVVGALAEELLAQERVHVREDQVDIVLREVVKGRGARKNAAEKRVVVFHVRLLVRGGRVAEEKRCFLFTGSVVLKRRNPAEFPDGWRFATKSALLRGGGFFWTLLLTSVPLLLLYTNLEHNSSADMSTLGYAAPIAFTAQENAVCTLPMRKHLAGSWPCIPTW